MLHFKRKLLPDGTWLEWAEGDEPVTKERHCRDCGRARDEGIEASAAFVEAWMGRSFPLPEQEAEDIVRGIRKLKSEGA